jgi:hypothetical protein
MNHASPENGILFMSLWPRGLLTDFLVRQIVHRHFEDAADVARRQGAVVQTKCCCWRGDATWDKKIELNQ